MEVGVLEVLFERGLAPDHLVGTSAGALNATVVAALAPGAAVARLRATWTSAEARAVFHASPRELLRNLAARRAWLRSNRPLRNLVRSALADLRVRRFSDLRLPLSVLVTDLVAGRSEVLTEGWLEDALVASCSVPGLFAPVTIADRMFVDGGVMENCSLATAAALDPRLVVAIDVCGADSPPAHPSWSDILDRSVGLSQQARVLSDHRYYAAGTPIALLCPRPSRHIGLLEPLNVAALIEMTASAARAAAPGMFGDDGEPAPGIHPIPFDLSPLEGRSITAAGGPGVTPDDAAARGAKWTRVLLRARRQAAWIELRSPDSRTPPPVSDPGGHA